MKGSQGDKECRQVYDYYTKILKDYLNVILLRLQKDSGEVMLENLIRESSKFRLFAGWMAKIFNYLDRFFTKEKGSKSLFATSLEIYKTKVTLIDLNV